MLSLPYLSPAELANAADANLFTHATWVQQNTPGMQVSHSPNLFLADSGLLTDTFNLIGRARLSPNDASQRIQAAIAHFTRAGRPFSWWLTPGYQPPNLPQLLIAAGLQPADTELAMAADLDQLPPGDSLPAGLAIRRVQVAGQLLDFAGTLIGDDDPAARQFYELAAPVLLAADCPLWLYVGYLDERPVATAELAIGGGVAGLYNISTLPAYRRRGIGTALTYQPLLDAKVAGYQTAILQAAEAGVNLYTRLGFRPFGHITEYKPE